MGRLDGKIALVSGGGSGIGEAVVARFAAEGATVFLGDIDAEKGTAVARTHDARFVPLDVSREDNWAEAIATVLSHEGRLDVLMNNAGVLDATVTTEELDLARWDALFAVNVGGVMLGCKHGGRAMLANPDGAVGSIVNVSSTAGLLAAGNIGYSASKGAVRLLTKAVALDFARRGLPIRCNSIHPGAVDTAIFDPYRQGGGEINPAMLAALNAMTPMGRIGRPDEIASLALFLASDESSFSTGSEFVADGGAVAGLAATPKG